MRQEAEEEEEEEGEEEKEEDGGSREEEDEAEAEEDVVESLSPVASVAFSLSSFVAFKTKDDCFFRPPS